MKTKKYRKLSEKITLSMAAWLFAVTALATFASYLHISSIVTHLIEDNLGKYIAIRGERESQSFMLAARNQQALAQRLVHNLKSQNVNLSDFSKEFERLKDGTIRDHPSRDHENHANFFIAKNDSLSEDRMRRILILNDFLERECYLSLTTFSNCWVAEDVGSIGVFQSDFSYADAIPADFQIKGQIWFQVITPENNLDRSSEWTKTYFDPHMQSWLITLSTPIYLNNKFIGAIGNDIIIGQLFDRLIQSGFSGT